jgi:hypothetical protein
VIERTYERRDGLRARAIAMSRSAQWQRSSTTGVG